MAKAGEAVVRGGGLPDRRTHCHLVHVQPLKAAVVGRLYKGETRELSLVERFESRFHPSRRGYSNIEARKDFIDTSRYRRRRQVVQDDTQQQSSVVLLEFSGRSATIAGGEGRGGFVP